MKRANPKVFEELAKLKYGFKKTSPMKSGLQMLLLDKFLLALDQARGELTNNIDVDTSGKIDMQRAGIWGFAKIVDGARTPQNNKKIPPKLCKSIKKQMCIFARCLKSKKT